jgi:glycosyltransferase involved in cell wall biosynthesis
MSDIKFSIVLPCYNEAASLPTLLGRYVEVWGDIPAELVLVNNGSTDNTAQVLLEELSKPELSFARTVLVKKNRGYGHGIFTGLKAAKGEFVGFSHADLQCDPADLLIAYKLLVAQADPRKSIVKGKRAPRDFASELVTRTMSALSTAVLMTRLSDINAQPKVFHRSLLDKLTNPPDGFQFDLYVLHIATQAGLEIQTIPVVFGERIHGESKWAATLFGRYRTILATIAYIFKLRFGSA